MVGLGTHINDMQVKYQHVLTELTEEQFSDFQLAISRGVYNDFLDIPVLVKESLELHRNNDNVSNGFVYKPNKYKLHHYDVKLKIEGKYINHRISYRVKILGELDHSKIRLGCLPNLIHSFESDITRQMILNHGDRLGITIHDSFWFEGSEQEFNDIYLSYLSQLENIFKININFKGIINDYNNNIEEIKSLKTSNILIEQTMSDINVVRPKSQSLEGPMERDAFAFLLKDSVS
ncbi:MAG: hypothetical protein GY738_30785 [Pseudoalteromonas sp.]|nr:hypothetical protein [Pseudoalteromonas sp.]